MSGSLISLGLPLILCFVSNYVIRKRNVVSIPGHVGIFIKNENILLITSLPIWTDLQSALECTREYSMELKWAPEGSECPTEVIIT